MSRQIDITQPLSDEDRQYLVDRHHVVALERNAAFVAGASVAGDEREEEKEDEDGPDLEDMTVQQLQEVLRKRDLPVSGTKDELLARLLEAEDD
jgi:SAP domain